METLGIKNVDGIIEQNMRFKLLKVKFIKNVAIRVAYFLRWTPDSFFLSVIYLIRTGKILHLHNPKRFNEKIQWLKIYDYNDRYTEMADKSLAKKWAAKIIGDEYIIPTLGIWDKFEDIPFEKLPNQFVLKCTHNSGGIYICKDKSQIEYNSLKMRFEKLLSINYFYQNREHVYKDIKPQIMAEPLLNGQGELIDYKFLCFNGNVEYMFTCTERFEKDGLKVTFFDRDFSPMQFERHYPRSTCSIPKPRCYSEMLEVAEKLSGGLKFVRVDLYEIDGQVYFGEMTFYPGSGMETFKPDEWDYKLGEYIELYK